MNAPFVADSSVSVSWVVATQASPQTDDLLDQIVMGCELTVPTLWGFEVANSLRVLVRRKRIQRTDEQKALRWLAGLPVTIDGEGCRLAFQSTAELAVQHGLSVYAAAYLELALRCGLPLATRDGPLRKAAGRSDVPLLI